MRLLLATLFSVLILAGCQSLGSPGYRIDEQATAQAQWKPGEVVAEGKFYWLGFETPSFYRKFIGITDKGYAVVQDFCADSGNKFTDPYVVMQPERIGDIQLLYKEMNNSSSTMLDGELTVWYENGKKASEYYYHDGNRQGLWIQWYEDGQKDTESYYQDGERQGLWTVWYRNGQRQFEVHYQDGKEHGLWTRWFENGQKAAEGQVQDGKEQGSWTYWFENGQKWQEGNYQDGKEQGPWTYWDEDGKKIRETLYESGKFVRETNF